MLDEVITGYGRTGELVRRADLRHRAGHDHHRQGADLRLPAAVGAAGRRPHRRDAGREGRRILPRLHLFRASGGLRGGAEEPRDHRARRAGRARARPTPAPISRRRCRSASPATRWSARCAAIGLMGAIEIVKDKATRERFLPAGSAGGRRARPCDRQRPDAARDRRHDDPVAAADLDARDDRHRLRAGAQGARSGAGRLARKVISTPCGTPGQSRRCCALHRCAAQQHRGPSCQSVVQGEIPLQRPWPADSCSRRALP